MRGKEEILKAKFANHTFENLTAKEETLMLEAMEEYAAEQEKENLFEITKLQSEVQSLSSALDNISQMGHE